MSLVKIFERIGSGEGPHLVITAGIHGDEFEGVEAVRRLVPAIESTAFNGSVTLVPIANESAFALQSRVGADDLDLARTFPGREDGSITERVANELSGLIRSADLYIDLHSGGKAMRIEPLAGYMLVDNSEILDKQREMAHAFGLSIVWGTSDKLDGRSLSVARDAGVPAIYAEYLGGGGCSDHGVDEYVEGCLNVMRWAGMLDRSGAPVERPVWVFEDARPSSGHIQICHPSPVDGAFMSTEYLGRRVRVGDELGRVAGAHAILADRSGRLICLRVDGRVEKGDALAVILETDPLKPNA